MNLSQSEYKAIVEFSPNMIWRAGTDSLCNYFNETWLRFTGKKLEEEAGNGWVKGVHLDDLDFCIKKYLESFSKREAFEMEYRLIRFDGEWRWINDRGVPFYEEDGTFAGYIGSCMDVTERVEGKRLTEMAHNDQLTGIYNRNYLDYLLSYEFHIARTEHTESNIMMMMDVDKFKYVNDIYGHSIGDLVLNQVAQKISLNIRESDIVGRYGGDEFLVILKGTTLDHAKIIAQKIINAIHEININNTAIKISLSIGIVKQLDENEAKDLLEKADKAMYNAKKSGGDKYSSFEDTREQI